MANELKGEVAFTAGDDDYVLLLDWEAMFAIEDALDRPIDRILAEIGAAAEGGAPIKMGTMATVLACGLRAHHPGLTRGDAGQLLADHGDAIGEALGLAIERSMPHKDDPGQHPRKPGAKKRALPATGKQKP